MIQNWNLKKLSFVEKLTFACKTCPEFMQIRCEGSTNSKSNFGKNLFILYLLAETFSFNTPRFSFLKKTKDSHTLVWNPLLNYYLISCQVLRTFSWRVTSEYSRKPPLTSFKIHIACGPSNRHFMRFKLNAKISNHQLKRKWLSVQHFWLMRRIRIGLVITSGLKEAKTIDFEAANFKQKV